MDKKLAGLLGAAAALTTLTAAQAAPVSGSELPQATSYRDLLDPAPSGPPRLWSAITTIITIAGSPFGWDRDTTGITIIIITIIIIAGIEKA